MSKEVVEEAVRAMLALKSVRIDCTTTAEGDAVDDPGSTQFTLIVVGEDYHRGGDIGPGEEVAQAVRAILGEPTESIHYRGVDYVRDPRYGDWLTMRPERQQGAEWAVKIEHTVDTVGEDDTLNEAEYQRQALLFGTTPARMQAYSLLGLERLGDSQAFHVRGETSQRMGRDELPNLPVDEIAKSMMMPPETRANLERILGTMPNEFREALELWIDESTHLIHRLEYVHEGFRDGRPMHHRKEIRLYSEFNEAELPGPLPTNN